MINDYSHNKNIHALTTKLAFFARGRQLVIVCIGTDLVGGDCLGPLTGQLLLEAGIPAYVYGTLEHPITALNVNAVSDFVRFKHPSAVIVAVDSSVGSKKERGKINIRHGPLLPGAAGGKVLKPVGDVSVTAVTLAATPDKSEFMLTGLGFVYPIAKSVANVISVCARGPLSYDNYYTSKPHFLQIMKRNSVLDFD